MKTAIRNGRAAAKAYGLKAIDDEENTFEAIVSVFGNVDLQNDRIVAGAFAGSLERWKASGDPIPVIWSHQWDNLDAHVGAVIDAKEIAPGDPALPIELALHGGLWTKFRIDSEDPPSAKVATLLGERRIREFSFAYDVFDEKRAGDGVNELLELDILEVGPTLKGANPATRLLSQSLGLPGGAKASVPVEFAGSIEAIRDGVWGAADDWARQSNIANGGLYALHLEATFPDDTDPSSGKAIVLLEGWDDPYGEGVFFELSYSTDDDGEVVVADPHELEMTVEMTLKARPLAQRARGKSLSPEVAAGRVKSATKDNEEDPAGPGNSEDPEEQNAGEASRALLDIDLLDFES